MNTSRITSFLYALFSSYPPFITTVTVVQKPPFCLLFVSNLLFSLKSTALEVSSFFFIIGFRYFLRCLIIHLWHRGARKVHVTHLIGQLRTIVSVISLSFYPENFESLSTFPVGDYLSEEGSQPQSWFHQVLVISSSIYTRHDFVHKVLWMY